MSRASLIVIIGMLAAAPAGAQVNDAYRPRSRGGMELEALFRREWTRNIFVSPTETENDGRWRLRAMPRLTTGGKRFSLGVGGDFNYSGDVNLDPTGNGKRPTELADNYDSRDARLDLAYLRLEPVHWLRLDGGRFAMPLGLTEMLWDRDLRPQGGAARLTTGALGDIQALSGAFLIAQGSHVFNDGDARMMALSGSAQLKADPTTQVELTASLVDFARLDGLEQMIRRQNTRSGSTGVLRKDYRVVDFVIGVRAAGNVPIRLTADIAWNTRLAEGNRGLWLTAVLGDIQKSRAQTEYTYARVDRDVTVAAYATDDFLWGTGWEGHRLDLATRGRGKMSLHLIGQLQRFKDSSDPDQQTHWVQRIRTEVRLTP